MSKIAIKESLLNYSLGQKIEINENYLIDSKLEINLEDIEFTLRKVSRIVFDKNEDNIYKLTTIFSTVNSLNSDIFYILDNKNSNLNFYIGVFNNQDVVTSDNTLNQVINSNFNGCEISDTLLTDSNDIQNIQNILSNSLNVTMTTAIPSFKDKDEKKENFVQGLEKFLLAMQDKDYTAIFLAKNISSLVETRKGGYEELYTNLFPLITKDLTIGKNSSESLGNSITNTNTKTINNTVTTAISKGNSTTIVKPSIMQKVQMTGIPSALALAGAAVGASTGGVGALAIGAGAAVVLGGTGLGAALTKVVDKKNTIFDSKNETENENRSTTTVDGTIDTSSFANGESETYTIGESSQVTIKYEDKFIKNKIDAIDMQLDRIKQSQNYGMFDFAAYFISSDISVSNTAANIYNSLIRGDESYLGNSYIIPFNSENSKIVSKYLANFEHPKFKIEDELISISSMVNSRELAIAMNFPKKSLHGLLVKESVEFGREIIKKYENQSVVDIGNIYHLGKNTRHNVKLPLADFSMHTLITGATGSGKSTTTYKLIDELINKEVKFLVIEPTKGEYKHIFGNQDDVSIYGTNNNYTELLKINPFSFPSEIHILEHIDRLVEIFNACWPMYAAMPAVLKDAILNAYEMCGWDLDNSICDDDLFPNFDDVLVSLNNIMESSLYSDNTKSDYKGALSTRIESLTKGLVGKIFDGDEITDEKLFKENVIVDLSRVGSSETKSLIMGILLLKLNQYRIAKGKMNDSLNHVTILEEAHHLLPRTSKETSSESGNIKGKAVEMLSNAIAEMRTYGEGFIIVDQSPNMLDISAIRNTNTKIIMRLSELEDRNDIGKSATLKEEQIDEIPKLERGVAIIYQNGWEEAILCKIKKSMIENVSQKFLYTKRNIKIDKKEILTNIIKIITLNKTNILKEEREIIEKDLLENQHQYKEWASNYSVRNKALFFINNKIDLDTKEKAGILNSLLNGRKILSKINNIKNAKTDTNKLIAKDINISNNILEYLLVQLLKIANSHEKENMIDSFHRELEKNLITGVK